MIIGRRNLEFAKPNQNRPCTIHFTSCLSKIYIKIKKSLQVYFYNFHAFNLKTVFQKLHGVTCSNPKHTSKTKIRFTQLRKVLRSSSSSKPTL